MISNQVLQSTIDGIQTIAKVELGVMDSEGREQAVTAPVFSEAASFVPKFAQSPADTQSWGDFLFFKIFDEQVLEFVLVIQGGGDNGLVIGKMAAFQIQGLVGALKERYDRDSFIKNLLLDNLLLVDIYGRAKKLHISANTPRVVIIIETGEEKDQGTLELMQQYAGAGGNDFVTAVDENGVIVVKDLSEGSKQSDVQRMAEAYIAFLTKNNITDAHIAYGTAVGELKEVSRSYKEAQLPIPLCKMFIREVFGSNNPDDFDEETLTTINKFFENNLNVSETSRQLFIHRNTLVYRLDKLQKSTGLDLRVFDDAITFKIALMVVKYMNYMSKMDTFEY